MARRSRRATFGPIVLLGLAAGALAAVASSRVWVSHDLTQNGVAANVGLVNTDLGKLPLAAALALLLLATWGILLVTRGRVRLLLTGFGALVALGLAVCVVAGFVTLPGDVRDTYAPLTGAGYQLSTSFTGWFFAAAVGALLSLVATGLGVLNVSAWPEMGRRYDAPGTETARTVVVDPDDVGEIDDAQNREIWKAIDDGQDPTAS